MPATKPLASFEVESNQGYSEFDGPACYENFPARLSLPLPSGVCTADETLEVRGSDGKVIPSIAQPFVRWPDGSVRVWDVSLPVSQRRAQKTRFELQRVAKMAARPAPDMRATLDATTVSVSMKLENGADLSAQVRLSERTSGSDDSIRREDEFALKTAPTGPAAFTGAIVTKTWPWYPGTEWEIRLTNVGPDDTTIVRGVRVEFDLPPGGGRARYIVRQTAYTGHGHPRLTERDNPLEIRADHEGICITDWTQIGDEENNYPSYERGSYVRAVAPWLGVADAEATWALVIPDAIERMPKAWRIDGRKVVVELHPQASPALNWRQGMTIFQRIVLVRLPANAEAREIENAAEAWLRPPIVRLDPDAYRNAGWRIPFRYDPKRFPKTEFHFRDSFAFSWSRGTFDWGDQLAGGKGGGSVVPGTKAVARNLEYDFVAVAAKEYARTGVANLLRMCRASAEHMMYTDFVAVSSDPWKEGGIVHHCFDHTSGSAYPSHMWAEGLTLYHQLSGDPYPLYVAKRVGDFYLKYIRERFGVVQATAREVGWTLIALSAIYDVTREQRYLDGIRRVVDYNLEQGREKFFPTDACFTIGIAIIGFNRTREFHRDRDTQRFIFELLDWMMENRRDEIGLFEYWRDPEQGAIPYVQTHLPEALNIGYKLSGDEKYLRAALRLYQIHLGGGILTVQNRYGPPECGYAAGNHISWMGCLQSFAEKGWLDQLQYRDPK